MSLTERIASASADFTLNILSSSPKVENSGNNDSTNLYIQDDESDLSEEEMELLDDDGFIDSEEEQDLSLNDIDNEPYGRCVCSRPFTSKLWCPDCQRDIYKQKKWLTDNPIIEANLRILQDRVHCPFCTLDFIDYKAGFKNVENIGKNLTAEPLFSKIGFKEISGADPTRVFLKDIGTTNCCKDYLNEISCADCPYELGNLLPYYGVTQNQENQIYLVMPYVPNGSLRDYLRKPENHQSFPWFLRLAFLHNLAEAIAGLHDKQIVHKNLHPNNILIGKNIESPVISDVGLSTSLSEIFGVLPYIDPSTYASDYGKESNVYSFAFVMYEVATFNLPFSNVAHDESLAEQIVNGLRPSIPEEVPIYFEELMKMCWDAQPTERPTMKQVSNILKYWRNHQIVPNFHATISCEFSADGKEDTTLFDSFQNARSYPMTDSEISKGYDTRAFDCSRQYSFTSEFKCKPKNQTKHQQKPRNDPIKKYIIPYEGPLIFRNDSGAPVQNIVSCSNCNINQHNPTWWCNTCETLRLRDKFGSWTSGNKYIDKFIQYTQMLAPSREGCMEWIPFSDLEVTRQVGQGGFSRVLHAVWNSGPMVKWNKQKQAYDRKNNVDVALKQLKDSQNINWGFFQELIAHLHCESKNFVLRCYGITRDPKSKEYIMVCDYAREGNLREYIHNKFDRITWLERYELLQSIANGLERIHDEGWVHRDLHTGNLLLEPCSVSEKIVIGDLGMCKPANYIRDGWRPGIMENAPESYVELMWRCWESDPKKRPNINEISTTLTFMKDVELVRLYANESYMWEFPHDSDGNENNNERLDKGGGKNLNKEYVINSEAFYTSRIFSMLEIERDLENLDLVDSDKDLIPEEISIMTLSQLELI
ncbi:5192_t:CDS:2 [Acaulospora morrowiae]|uniref:5192_t:CDS:1 n=1 Tax=Acaulospora morrowiae TaxID=94023 RepID=A0A9N9F4H0_9GLOM|nr:5192_t:CDS:2 [Acaulospora morrowiae]